MVQSRQASAIADLLINPAPSSSQIINAGSNNNAESNVGLSDPLLPVHRLDQCTEGLVFLGRSPAAVRQFQALQQEGRVRKRYRVLCSGPQPPPKGKEVSADVLPAHANGGLLATVALTLSCTPQQACWSTG